MTINTDYVQQMASQLASYEVQASSARIQRNQAAYKSRLEAVGKLETALRSFASTLRGLKSAGSSLLVNKATFSQEGAASATVGASAASGSYSFFVEQLASSHQLALEGLQDGDVPASGTLDFSQNGKNFSIDLAAIDSNNDGTRTLDELAAAINGAADNSGVQASLLRSNGQVTLVLASETSGASNAIGLSTSGIAAGTFASAVSAPRELTAARDARVRLGGETGILFTNNSNTFDSLIQGVSLTFNKAHLAGEQPLAVTIGQDAEATKGKAQSFIDAFNTLMSTFDSLTATGGESSTRGVLAGDSSIRGIESMLNQVLRETFGGKTLMGFGIAADRNGKLTIDTARFDKAVAADPQSFEQLFTAKDALLDRVDSQLALYTSSVNGVLKNRKENLNGMLRRADDQYDGIQKQYDLYYARYLKQYTNMMQMTAAMEQTYGMFG